MNRHGIIGWLCAMLCLASGLIGPEVRADFPVTQFCHAENIRVHCRNAGDLPALYQIVQTVSAEVRKWLRCYHQRPKTELSVMLVEEKTDAKQNPFHRKQMISSKDSPEQIYSRIIAAVIARFIAENCRGGNRNLEALDWISAGLYHRIYYDGKGFTLRYTPDFRIAREQFDHGFYPSLELLLTRPVPVRKKQLYLLYSLYCDIFLKVLEEQDSQKQAVLRKFLDFQSYDRPQIESLQFILKGRIGSRGLEAWYREEMYKQSGEGIRKAQADDVARQLRDIVTVPFIARDRPGQISDRPLYELEKDKLTENFLRRRRIELARLHLRAPLLMQPPLILYIQALKCRTVRGMKKKYREAENAFRKAWRQQQTAEKMLDRYEQNAPGKMGSFMNDWEIIQRYLNLRQELFAQALRLNPEE